MLAIGLMSGTSMDGIDAAILETDGDFFIKTIDGISLQYDTEFKILLKAAEYAVRKKSGDLIAAKQYFPEAIQTYLETELKTSAYQAITKISFDNVVEHSTQLHATAVKQLLDKTGYSSKQVDVIGYHGQTLFHQPKNKITIQVGNGQQLADQTNITVVNDFRIADVLAGGQGAPLAPLYHQALAVRDNKIPIAVLNCGGIANITVVSGIQTTEMIGFDTGPGNGLIDRYIKQVTQGKETMDADGKYGLQGKVNQAVFEKLYEQLKNFIQAKPPKSLDIGDFELIPELNLLSLEDACATLEAFTADTIVKSLEHLPNSIPSLWVLAGGGWNNPVIYNELKIRLFQQLGSSVQIKLADEIGWSSQYMEAQIFAYLAVRCLQNKPISFPNTTQVLKPLTGGKIYHSQHP